jgi:hypothetical protein
MAIVIPAQGLGHFLLPERVKGIDREVEDPLGVFFPYPFLFLHFLPYPFFFLFGQGEEVPSGLLPEVPSGLLPIDTAEEGYEFAGRGQ